VVPLCQWITTALHSDAALKSALAPHQYWGGKKIPHYGGKYGTFTELELCTGCDIWITSQKRLIHLLQYLIIHGD